MSGSGAAVAGPVIDLPEQGGERRVLGKEILISVNSALEGGWLPRPGPWRAIDRLLLTGGESRSVWMRRLHSPSPR